MQPPSIAQTKMMTRFIALMANVKDEPRPRLARLLLLGARGVTAGVVGSSAWLGIWASLYDSGELLPQSFRFFGRGFRLDPQHIIFRNAKPLVVVTRDKVTWLRKLEFKTS